uniref:Uncharacterized protein n=1 Tax=Rhizophora mucronata TaxID=61149 RepID=A0A2P2NFD9_RHIMU
MITCVDRSAVEELFFFLVFLPVRKP